MIGFNRTHGYINCSKGKAKNEIKGYGFFSKMNGF
jgi:cold shock CspA family protein